MMGELSLWRSVILIGLAFVLAAGGLVLPWGVHQLAGRLPDGSWRRSLTFSTEFVPKSGHFAFDWTDFSQSFVWRGDLYFVETVSPVDYLNATYVIFADLPSSHRPARRVMAWNLATRRARVVAACREQMMYFVHDDRLVVLNLPTTRSDVVWRNSLAQKRVFKWRFVGPFDFQCRPSVLAIDDGNLSPPLSWLSFLGVEPSGSYEPKVPPSATLLCYENDRWIERGDVPLPKTFADWNGRVIDAFPQDGEICIECRIGWDDESQQFGRFSASASYLEWTLIRRGLFSPDHAWDDYESNAVWRAFPPLWWFMSPPEEEPVSALLPDNVSPTDNSASDLAEETPVSAMYPANASEESWRQIERDRRRAEAAAMNQPASALDPENRLDWRQWEFDDELSVLFSPMFTEGFTAILPRHRKVAEARFSAEEMLWHRYRLKNVIPFFPSSSQLIDYARRQDRSFPRRLVCEIHQSEMLGRAFLGNLTLNGRRLVINNDGRDILNDTGIIEFGAVHTQVIAVEALDDSAVWLVGRRSDGRIDLHRIDEQGSHPVGSLAGPLRWMIARQAGLLLALVSAVPALLFLIVGFGLVRGRMDPTYSFGHRTIQLAPVGRRGLARLIDTAVILLPLAAGLLLSHEFGTWWSRFHGIVSMETGTFLQLRGSNGAIRWEDAWRQLQRFPWSLLQILLAAPVGWLAAVLSVMCAAASCVAKARRGMALGGWLCGVRVWRTTLRPCGLARSLLRELFLIAETLGGWLWLSPLLMLALSSHSRRWGDRISDTIVVKAVVVQAEGKKSKRAHTRLFDH